MQPEVFRHAVSNPEKSAVAKVQGSFTADIYARGGSFYVPKERAAISAGDVQGGGECFPNEQNLALYYKDTARTVTDEQEHSLPSIIYLDYSPDSMDSC